MDAFEISQRHRFPLRAATPAGPEFSSHFNSRALSLSLSLGISDANYLLDENSFRYAYPGTLIGI